MYFTVKLGKVTAKKLFPLVILNESIQSVLRYSKKEKMGEYQPFKHLMSHVNVHGEMTFVFYS